MGARRAAYSGLAPSGGVRASLQILVSCSSHSCTLGYHREVGIMLETTPGPERGARRRPGSGLPPREGARAAWPRLSDLGWLVVRSSLQLAHSKDLLMSITSAAATRGGTGLGSEGCVLSVHAVVRSNCAVSWNGITRVRRQEEGRAVSGSVGGQPGMSIMKRQVKQTHGFPMASITSKSEGLH